MTLVSKEGLLILNNYSTQRQDTVVSSRICWLTYGDDTDSSHLRTVQVCGQHNDGVSQHIGSICTGKQSLSVEEDKYQGNMFGLF